MPVRSQEAPIVQSAISVSEMARRLTLSRGRFYELIKAGVFPSPCYCLHTRRALYPPELQLQCLQVRQTNVGINDRYILFYQARLPRSAVSTAPQVRRRRATEVSRVADPALAPIHEGLASLGMASVADDQIRAALRSAFPAGTDNIDSGTVLAGVFRQIRSPNAARFPSES